LVCCGLPFGPKREEVAGGWRRLHNEELHNLYASDDMGRERSTHEIRNAYSILGENPEGKRPLGKPKRRWEDTRTDLKEVGWEGVDRMHLAQNRDQWRALVNMVTNLRIP
jgi:hypothetical protein